MKLSHTRYDRLPSFLVVSHLERRVFDCELAKRDSQFFLIGFCLWLNCNRYDRLRKLKAFENYGLLFIRERIARDCAPKTDSGSNIPRAYFLDLLALVRVHSKESSNLLPRALR